MTMRKYSVRQPLEHLLEGQCTLLQPLHPTQQAVVLNLLVAGCKEVQPILVKQVVLKGATSPLPPLVLEPIG